MNAENDPLLELIGNYKRRIAETRLSDEVYKWQMVAEFRGRPNTEAPDFKEEIRSMKYLNLVYAMGLAVLNTLAENKAEQLRDCFRYLFDEEKELKDRLQYFNEETLKIYRELEPNLSHHQDERSMATYLTIYNPQKYTFYKSGFYTKYCKLIGVKPAKKNDKYVHYLELLDDFIEGYIKPDSELIEQVKSLIPDLYDGTDHKLLAQDILYQMLDKAPIVNYWIFQGNPDYYDITTALDQNLLHDWTVKAHRDKIKSGDKVIIWMTGSQAGCYALAEVISEPYVRSEDEEDPLWKKEGGGTIKVDIRITHNLLINPVLKQEIDGFDELKDLNAGNQGTNFKATQQHYEKLEQMAANRQSKRYWLYSPGKNARLWEDFYEEEIMGLGWDELGDLRKYETKEEIQEKLLTVYGGEGSKMNDTLANVEFVHKMNIGDVVIVKKGRNELLGYGEVTSEYQYDETREEYKHIREVDWQLKGSWHLENSLIVKTLTDITIYDDDYSSYGTFYERLMAVMTREKKDEEVNHPLNTIFYGPPGTGKTYHTILRAAEIIENRKIDDYADALRIFNQNLHQRIEFITFHQNYSYEDFVQGLRPDTENDNVLTFERKDGIFKVIADKALKNLRSSETPQPLKKPFEEVFNEVVEPLVNGETEELEIKMRKVSYYITTVTEKSVHFRKATGASNHSMSIATLKKMYEAESDLDIQGLGSYYSPLLQRLLQIGKDRSGKTEEVQKINYVLIIDEINRANISRVFGELITLIEPDKRSHGRIPLKAKLPSGDSFMVPSNLFIIGTMNTADKSIALLDIALRRRFVFEAMYPLYQIEGQEIFDVDVLKKINKRIISTKGHDFQIGHAYFMGANADLAQRMNQKVIPLLMEYFMNDAKEVGDILQSAGLKIKENVWPLQIEEQDDE